MSALIPPLREKDTPPPKPVDDVQSAGAEVVEAKTKKEADGQGQSQGDVVASFEESSVAPPSKEQTPAYEPTSFLRKYPVSLVNVENLVEEPHDKKSPVIRAVTSEIVNVFKSAALQYGSERRVLLMHGPVGSSKSTIARLLKRGLEAEGFDLAKKGSKSQDFGVIDGTDAAS